MAGNMKKKISEKMLEQLISFNFLKSKVSHLAAIYQQKKNLSSMGKKNKEGCKFYRVCYMVYIISGNNIDVPFS